MGLPPIDAVTPGEKENDGDEYFHEVAFLVFSLRGRMGAVRG